MGCLGRFLLSALALWGFSSLGWITLAEGASIWLVAFYVMLVIILVDVLSILVKFLAHLVALPISILTLGFGIWVIEAGFKYIGLYLAAHWTQMFFLPWIFGVFWWQALLISMAFALICALTSSNSSASQRRRRSQ